MPMLSSRINIHTHTNSDGELGKDNYWNQQGDHGKISLQVNFPQYRLPHSHTRRNIHKTGMNSNRESARSRIGWILSFRDLFASDDTPSGCIRSDKVLFEIKYLDSTLEHIWWLKGIECRIQTPQQQHKKFKLDEVKSACPIHNHMVDIEFMYKHCRITLHRWMHTMGAIRVFAV